MPAVNLVNLIGRGPNIFFLSLFHTDASNIMIFKHMSHLIQCNETILISAT